MFPDHVYIQRRQALKNKFAGGLLLFLGNTESPANCGDSLYPFRQDSTFLYYWGVDRPDLAAVLDLDEDRAIVFGDDHSLENTVWEGPGPGLDDQCRQAGIESIAPSADLAAYLTRWRSENGKIHFLPAYRPEHTLALARLLNIPPGEVADLVSEELIRAVVAQRSLKSESEIEEIESALEVTCGMHTLAMSLTRPGLVEREVAAAIKAYVYRHSGKPLAFGPIFSVRGEVLHNPWHRNTMEEGQMVVHDSGTQTAHCYNSDITRTIPVSGQFTSRQKEVYEIVLAMQTRAIAMMVPGVAYRDVHLAACRRMAEGLKELGLMRGDISAAVEAGAHALFMPHGLGHMLGLDVHDMDALGEDFVGYSADFTRSPQFGLDKLRLARNLEAGFVVTVEPGIYFIPALMDRWLKENRFTEFIDFQRLDAYRKFGGIRIEDDVLVTDTGARVLGPPIPKTIAAVEAACRASA